jgi:CheY-like chemotaxis protein
MSGDTANTQNVARTLVLVVEDHDTSAEGYAQVLGAAGYHTVRAKDGYEALIEVSRQAPKLVVLDLRLPKLDGWDLLERLKGDSALSAIPVVIVTADSLPTHHEIARSRGASAVLTKPIEPDELIRAVREALAEALSSGGDPAPHVGLRRH